MEGEHFRDKLENSWLRVRNHRLILSVEFFGGFALALLCVFASVLFLWKGVFFESKVANFIIGVLLLICAGSILRHVVEMGGKQEDPRC